GFRILRPRTRAATTAGLRERRAGIPAPVRHLRDATTRQAREPVVAFRHVQVHARTARELVELHAALIDVRDLAGRRLDRDLALAGPLPVTDLEAHVTIRLDFLESRGEPRPGLAVDD